MDLYQNKNDPAELYTTIGPDGKNKILSFIKLFTKNPTISLLPSCEVACTTQLDFDDIDLRFKLLFLESSNK